MWTLAANEIGNNICWSTNDNANDISQGANDNSLMF